MSSAPKLDGLREKHGGKHFRCQECGNHVSISGLIDDIEEQELDVIFTPETIDDLAFKLCEECGRLRLHEMVDEIDNIEPEEQSDGHSKPEDDASGQSEPNDDIGSSKPFSI